MLASLIADTATSRQSALVTAGPAADRIGELWNFMLVFGGIVSVLVFAGFAYALFRRLTGEPPPEADREADRRGELHNDETGGRGHEGEGRPRSERVGVRVMVGAGVVFPTIALGALLVFTLRTLSAVSLPSQSVASEDEPPAPGELVVEVTGMQYWWRVRYLDRDPTRVFETANELRIPVGRPVTVRLRSGDVIHSFWVPGLHGKMDLVPGRVNAIAIEANHEGTWRGQCAEFCGQQHAKMAFNVVAESAEEYERWAAGQRAPAAAPADSLGRANAEVFLASGCVLCHAVRGTTARGTVGPDLTHVTSRLSLAGGALPNTTGHLYGWVANPQALKPGSRMPAVDLDAGQLRAIVDYLRTLE